jgi:hypothetical protein
VLGVLLALATAAPAMAAPTWHDKSSGTGFFLNAVSAPDASHAWAVGGGGSVVATQDGGETWAEQVDAADSAEDNLHAVSFVNDQDGWAVGEGGTIVATTDGGEHWTLQTSPTTLILYGVDFVDSQHGWAVGEADTILATEDGGATWTEQAVEAPDGRLLHGVSFVNDQDGWAVGQGATVFATTDGGEHGTVVGSPSRTIYSYYEVPAGLASGVRLEGVPTAATAGEGFQFEISALESGGNVLNSFAGEVSFRSSDPAATLPSAQPIAGSEIPFDFILRTPGPQTITVEIEGVSATTAPITVSPGPTKIFKITTPATVTAGTQFPFTVEAFDESGNPTPTFTGAVEITTSAEVSVLPLGSMVIAGTGHFQATLLSGGEQTISATDVATGTIAGTSDPITVEPAPSSLSVLPSPGVILGAAIQATAKIDGLDPTGHLQFDLYGPGDATCTGAPVDSVMAPIDGAGEYESPPFTPTAAGTYRWIVTYPGDRSDTPAATECADPAAAVVVAAPAAPPAPPAEEHQQSTPPAQQQGSPPPPAPPAPHVHVSYDPNHAHSPNKAGGARYTFVFADEAPGVTFYCRLDGKPWKACSSPAVYRNLARGRHVFRVKSVDAAGTESAVETVKFTAGRHRR